MMSDRNGKRPAAARQLIDWHTHVWLPDHLGDWGDYMPGVTKKGGYAAHEAAMNEAGVERFIVIALTSRYLEMGIPNDYIAAFVQRHGDRAIGVASVDPNDPGALEELERAVVDLGLRGVKLSPPYQQFHPHSDEAFAVYELAAKLGLFMIFHQGSVFHPRCKLDTANPLLLDEVAQAFPSTKIVIAHLGQPWIAETTAVMARHKNVLTDISARLNRPWQLYNGLMSAIDYRTIDRVVFGTDFPLITPAKGVQALMRLNERMAGAPPIPPEIIEDVLYRRPLSLLGASPVRDGRVTPAGAPVDDGGA
jgi:predicted TIM-barrel fold metal-dependent hydrolase